MTVTVNNLYCN